VVVRFRNWLIVEIGYDLGGRYCSDTEGKYKTKLTLILLESDLIP
jgi:hypothetical protein